MMLRRAVVSWLLSLLVVAMTVAACGSDAPQVDASPGAPLYESNCASCHGSQLQGSSEGPSLLSIVYEPNHHSDDSIRSAIAKGAPEHHWNFGDMEPIEGLSVAEVELVITHVRAEQERQGFDR